MVQLLHELRHAALDVHALNTYQLRATKNNRGTVRHWTDLELVLVNVEVRHKPIKALQMARVLLESRRQLVARGCIRPHKKQVTSEVETHRHHGIDTE